MMARIYSFLDKEAVQKLVDEHLEGKQNRRLFIWSLLNFEWWNRVFCS
jgi:asparagine synthase (glutamine-hydrolysing)